MALPVSLEENGGGHERVGYQRALLMTTMKKYEWMIHRCQNALMFWHFLSVTWAILTEFHPKIIRANNFMVKCTWLNIWGCLLCILKVKGLKCTSNNACALADAYVVTSRELFLMQRLIKGSKCWAKSSFKWTSGYRRQLWRWHSCINRRSLTTLKHISWHLSLFVLLIFFTLYL